MDFDAFTRDIKNNGWNVFGAEVYEDGVLTHHYGDTAGLHDIYSATKTILSVAVGIAYDEGLIDLHRSFLDYLPEDKLSKLDEERYERFKKITIRRLLTMSVPGFPFRPEGDSYIDFALACDIEDDNTFSYGNIPAYLIGVCLTNAIGSDLGRFIEERIFAPLNITEYSYGRCPEGYFYGASQMRLSVHDMSKIGLLLMNLGIYDGKRIVSEEYVRQAVSVQQVNKEGGYGYFIWKYRDGFSINGKLKQKCYVLPEKRLVITYLSHIESDSHDLLDSMERNILGLKRIIHATEADREELLALYKAQLGREFCPWTEDYPGNETIDFDLSREALFVMKEYDRIIAAISLEEDKDVDALDCWDRDLALGGELARLAVLPEKQGRGIAKQMMSFGMNAIRERGFKSIHFLVNKYNEKAIRAYSVFKFDVVGECHMFDQDFLCYEKTLKES